MDIAWALSTPGGSRAGGLLTGRAPGLCIPGSARSPLIALFTRAGLLRHPNFPARR